MQHAFHAALGGIEVAGGQLEVLVRTAVLECVQRAVEVEHRDRRLGDLVEHHLHLAGQQLGGGADVGPGLAHSAFSSTSKRRSSRCGWPKRSSPYGNGLKMPVRL